MDCSSQRMTRHAIPIHGLCVRVLDSKSFVGTATTLARIAQSTYQHGDGHGAPDSKSKKTNLAVSPLAKSA
ncbi:unnamed protein product [Dovyalis caffra]|uniref:Uncharacterized protein n=1 Tax=Dovyalis caffra TaxID=77055 RepID=A0AAV1SQF5_9ROSI|nr:unnamed protein product [Dovyalis caffra]